MYELKAGFELSEVLIKSLGLEALLAFSKETIEQMAFGHSNKQAVKKACVSENKKDAPSISRGGDVL